MRQARGQRRLLFGAAACVAAIGAVYVTGQYRIQKPVISGVEFRIPRGYIQYRALWDHLDGPEKVVCLASRPWPRAER